MLELLRVKNLALLQDLEMEFSPGLNVITGETGAGKSFIIKALDFLSGSKMDPAMIRPGAEAASMEALFHDDGQEVIIRRELNAKNGRSRIYINDRLSSKDAAQALGATLFSHTSQHKQQELLKPAFQSKTLDMFIKDRSLLRDKDTALGELNEILAQKLELEERSRDLLERREFLEYQKNEIDKVSPGPDEENELILKKESLKEMEKAAQSVESALNVFAGDNSVTDRMSTLLREVDRITVIYEDFSEYRSFLDDGLHQLLDLEARLRSMPGNRAGGQDLDAIESRLFELSSLRRKLGRSLSGIADLKDEIEENLSFLDSCQLEKKRLKRLEREAADKLNKVLSKLNSAREAAGKELAKLLEQELKTLGFAEQVRVKFQFEDKELYPGLFEYQARMLWIPNPGQPAQPLDRIASGGELSRVFLALSGILADQGMPTMVFDEIDSGIGGLTLNSVADKLSQLSENRQMVVITHWPQLAARAERHFFVEKKTDGKKTTTACTMLAKNQVQAELSRMSGKASAGALDRNIGGAEFL